MILAIYSSILLVLQDFLPGALHLKQKDFLQSSTFARAHARKLLSLVNAHQNTPVKSGRGTLLLRTQLWEAPDEAYASKVASFSG